MKAWLVAHACPGTDSWEGGAHLCTDIGLWIMELPIVGMRLSVSHSRDTWIGVFLIDDLILSDPYDPLNVSVNGRFVLDINCSPLLVDFM